MINSTIITSKIPSTMEQPEISLIERFEKLNRNHIELSQRMLKAERSAQSWRFALLALALTALFMPIAARTLMPDLSAEISSRNFTLRDSNGNRRASLYMSQEHFPALTFYNPNGDKTINLASSNENSSGLFFYDSDKHIRLAIGRELKGKTGLLLHDPETHRFAISLTNDALGRNGLTISDPQGNPRILAGIRASGQTGVQTRDAEGRVLFESP